MLVRAQRLCCAVLRQHTPRLRTSVPAPDRICAAWAHAVTGKGERRRVRTFRKEYRPQADLRAVRLPTNIDDSKVIPMDIIVPWLDRVEKGVQAMVPSNEGMAVTRESATSLKVTAPEVGDFSIYLDDDHRRLVIMSPAKTGTLANYHWNEALEQFESVIDGHNAVELLARDLIFTLRGVPDF